MYTHIFYATAASMIMYSSLLYQPIHWKIKYMTPICLNIFRFFSCPSLIWLYTTTLDNSIHPFCIPFIETKSFCQRSFSFTGAAQWNSLSYEITSLLLSNLLWRPICSSLLIVSIFSSLLICWFFHILLLLCACVWRGARAGGSGSVLLWLCVPLCNVHINV